ncbi:MAG: hypothetical protein Q7S51_02865 [Gallionellaceae bacterium]|nr:hypothetical protein [Gallionellaceae bacterium]
MYTLKYSLLALSLGFTLSVSATAGDIYVISNSATKLSAAEAKDAFLGEQQFIDGKPLVIVNNAEITDDFTSKVLHMGTSGYKLYWVKKSFRDGVKLPITKSNDAEVLNAVRSTVGAIGYVTSQPSGVNIIQKY